MLRNRTKEQISRGMRGTASWSVVTQLPGAALCVYCPSSIPSESTFDGTLNFRHTTAQESKGILDNRQLQM
jgi:hypothetical protein